MWTWASCHHSSYGPVGNRPQKHSASDWSTTLLKKQAPADQKETCFGSPELRLPDELRGPLLAHLNDLRTHYRKRQWGNRVGFGARPAVVVIDLARFWLDPKMQIGSNLD